MGGNGPLIQPPTTRIGGGGSAHAVAIGVVVVLVALVWVGWSGRPAGPSAGVPQVPSGTAAPTVVGAVNTPPGATSVPVEVTPRLTPRPWATGPTATLRPSVNLGDDVYAVTAGGLAGGAGTGSVLHEVERGHLHAELELPATAVDHDMFLELHQLSSLGMPNKYVPLRSFPLLQGELAIDEPGDVGTFHLLVPNEPNALNTSLLIRRGFDLRVRAIAGRQVVELVVDISLLPKTRRPADEDHRIFPFVR